MEIKPGLYRFKNKEDWDYVVDNINFNNGKKENIKKYWNGYESNFVADIKLCSNIYTTSYASFYWWMECYPERQIIDYVANPYSVELL